MANSRTTTPWTSLPIIETIYGKNKYIYIYISIHWIHWDQIYSQVMASWLNQSTCRIRPRFTMILHMCLGSCRSIAGKCIGATKPGVSGLDLSAWHGRLISSPAPPSWWVTVARSPVSFEAPQESSWKVPLLGIGYLGCARTTVKRRGIADCRPSLSQLGVIDSGMPVDDEAVK